MGSVEQEHGFGDFVGEPLFGGAFGEEGIGVDFDEIVVAQAVFGSEELADVVREETEGEGVERRTALPFHRPRSGRFLCVLLTCCNLGGTCHRVEFLCAGSCPTTRG